MPEYRSIEEIPSGSPMRQLIDLGGDILALREMQFQNDTALLTRDQTRDLDRVVSEPIRQQISAANDLLMTPGFQHPNGLWAARSEWQRRNRMRDASVTTSIRNLFQRDRATYDDYDVPMVFVGEEYDITIQEMGGPNGTESVNFGNAREASRAVFETVEDIVINGRPTISGNIGALHGYTSHPDRITSAFSQSWDTAANAYLCYQEIITAMRDNGYFGPYMMYTAAREDSVLMSPEGVDRPYAAKERILRTLSSFGLRDSKISERLADGNVVCVSWDPQDVDIAVGQAVRSYQAAERFNFIADFLVMGYMAPRIKPRQGTDNLRKVGVAHFTTI